MQRVKALSIDGGGVRGIIAAKILASIEERTGSTISENFDIIIGCSTGGLLALGLSMPDKRGKSKYAASDLVDFYRTETSKIFRSSFGRKIRSGFGLWGPRYSRKGIDSVLRKAFGEAKLTDMMDSVIVNSYNLDSGLPHLWTSFSPKSDGDFYLYDVAGATCAIPTYLPPKVVYNDRKEYYSTDVDGGLYANNPAAVLLTFIKKLYGKDVDLDNILYVSIGSGKCPRHLKRYDRLLIKKGIVGWLLGRDLISTMMDANSEIVNSQMINLFSEYTRLQIHDLPEELMKSDNTSAENIKMLEKAADAYIEDNTALLDTLCATLKK